MQRDGDQLFSTCWRRDQEEVAVMQWEGWRSDAGMDFLMVTGEQAAGVVTRAESGTPLSAGDNWGIEPGRALGVTGQTGQ